MGQASAEQALRALDLLVGEWTVKAKGPGGQAWPGEGRASSQWHPSHAHLVQRIAIDVAGPPDSTSIIGCDAADGTYIQLYSDYIQLYSDERGGVPHLHHAHQQQAVDSPARG